MDTSTVILQIAVILIVAPVFGELIAGIILGPTLFGFIEAHGVIRILAEVGIMK